MIKAQNTKKNVAIIFGGQSSEYKISLQSAAAVLRHFPDTAYTPIPVGITPKGQWFRYFGDTDSIEKDTWQSGPLIPAFISPDATHHGLIEFQGNEIHVTALDAAFPVLHGKGGEDGTIQGLLSMAGIPLVGCATLSSALCMDKDMAHRLAAQAGIRVPKSIVLHTWDPICPKELEKNAANLGYPLFVKPANAGSSFGITRVTHPNQLLDAIKTAFSHDCKVILEEAIDGFEVGCSILGSKCLIAGEVDEIQLSDGFFDYTEKYTLKSSSIHMPARIPKKDRNRIRAAALTLYRALECDVFARIDMFFTKQGEIVFNEINTIPGFTVHSRYPGMLRGIGMNFEDIIQKLLEAVL